jgi:predicted ATP-grasp superfamily ATP-dependent carboligase
VSRVVWQHHPRLRRPVLLAAFEGWNDAGDAASFALRYLADQWNTHPFAEIDLEDFIDFTSSRPTVRLEDDGERVVDWPKHELGAAEVPWGSADVVTLVGPEPHLRWRSYVAEIIALAQELDVSMVVTLGALLAEVPHNRPVSVVGTADNPAVRRRLNLRSSRYEGPTGIVGALGNACSEAGIDHVSLWATVPTYVSAAPSPKAALALVERVAELLRGPATTTDLEIAASAYVRQIDELVERDDETAAYVAGLSEVAEDDDDDDDDSDDDDLLITGDAGPAPAPTPLAGADPEVFVEEVERFLRENPDR